MINKNDVTQQL